MLITEGLQARLEDLAERVPIEQRGLQPAEAPDRIAWHLSREIERTLNDVGETDRARVGIEVARALLDRLGEFVSPDRSVRPVDPASVLHAVLRRHPDGTPRAVTEPLTPLLDTTLLTNAPGEPNLWNQLRSEIDSADAIDVVMAFIRRSGISPLLDALARHCAQGRPLRVLTTTYTGSTERRALEPFADLGAEVRAWCGFASDTKPKTETPTCSMTRPTRPLAVRSRSAQDAGTRKIGTSRATPALEASEDASSLQYGQSVRSPFQ